MKNKGCWWIIGAILAISIVIAIFEHAISWIILALAGIVWLSWVLYKNKETKGQKISAIIGIIICVIILPITGVFVHYSNIDKADSEKIKKEDKPKIENANDKINSLSTLSSKKDFSNATRAIKQVKEKSKRESLEEDLQKERGDISAQESSTKKRREANLPSHQLKKLNGLVKSELKKSPLVGKFNVSIQGHSVDVDTYPVTISIYDIDGSSAGSEELATLNIIKAIQKVDYTDFTEFYINYKTDLVNNKGAVLKKMPVLKYTFTTKTIGELHPSRMDAKDLKINAKSYWKRNLSN